MLLFANNATTECAGSISATATQINVAAGEGVLFPNPGPNDYFVATLYKNDASELHEIIWVTARNGDTMTIVRAQENTQAQIWNPGDTFSALITAGALAQFVQQGGAGAPTSILYVGEDVSTTPNLVIAPTNPVPAMLETGMQFNLKIANTNRGPVSVELNGMAGVPATRTHGGPLVGGDLTADEEMIFIWNGAYLSTMIPPIPTAPPQIDFFVRPDGNDANSGFEDNAQEAFLTLQGAVTAIENRYVALETIILHVADGLYTSGISVDSSNVAYWYVVHEGDPANCIIRCTSTNLGSYVPGSPNGHAVYAGGTGAMLLRGFTLESYYGQLNAYYGGSITCYDCHFNATVSGNSAIQAGAGSMALFGSHIFTAGVTANFTIFAAGAGGVINIGYGDIYGQANFGMNIRGNPALSYTAAAQASGCIGTYDNFVGFSGDVPNNARWYAASGGGFRFMHGNGNIFPGTSPGVVVAPGWEEGWVAPATGVANFIKPRRLPPSLEWIARSAE